MVRDGHKPKLDSVLAAAEPWEMRFTILVLVMSTGAFLNIPGDFTSQQLDSGQGLWFMQVFWAFAYSITFYLIWTRSKQAIGLLFRQYWLVSLLLLALVSAAWSDVPALTLRRAAALTVTALFGAYFATRYDPRDQLRLLARACSIIIGFSILFSLLGIGHAVNTPDSGWIGVFVHRNAFGRMMVFSTIVFLSVEALDGYHARSGRLGVITGVALVVMSTSRGSIIYVALLLLLFLYLKHLRQVRAVLRSMVCMGLLLFGALCIIMWRFDAITAAMGRDSEMTGRVPMWIFSSLFALQRPWLGYGYSAFWRGADGPSVGVWQLLSWPAPHAHNGLLNLWLDLGLAGVGIFLFGFFLSVARSVSHLRSQHSRAIGLWPGMFLAFFFVSNLTESSMVDANTIFWIVYVSVFITLSRTDGPAVHRLTTRKVRRAAIPHFVSIPACGSAATGGTT